MSGGAPQSVADIPAPSVGGIDWGDDGNVIFTLNQGRGLFRVPATGGEPEELLEPAVRLRNPLLAMMVGVGFILGLSHLAGGEG